MSDHFVYVAPKHLRTVCLMVLQDMGVEDVALQVHKIRPHDTEYGVVYEPTHDLQPLHEIGIECLKMVADVLTQRYHASVNYIVRWSGQRYLTYLVVNGKDVGHYFNAQFEYPVLTLGDPAKWS